ncbi:MAG: hypothetical protein ACK4ZU_04030 [Allorhizobium sp.]
MRKTSKKHTYRDWSDTVEEINLIVATDASMSMLQAAVDHCNNIGISYGATDYERREAISNAVFGTGYHVDRSNKIARLSDLISLLELSLGDAEARPCVKFRVHAKLEEGREYLSDETHEFLDANGDIVSVNRHLDTNVAPLIEASRALDAYASDVEREVYRQLSHAVQELKLQKRVSVLVIRASDTTLRVVFDLYLDRNFGHACLGATVKDGSMIGTFEASAVSAIRNLAKTLAIDAAVVARFVRRKLQNALDNFEYWNFGDELAEQEWRS